jgi:hypothetical protein
VDSRLEGGEPLAPDGSGADAGLYSPGTEDTARRQRWRAEAAAQLHSWEVMYDELLDTIPEGTTQSLEYQPPEDDSFLRMSPVQLWARE